MKPFSLLLGLLLFLAAIAAPDPARAEGGRIGIVLMHGKLGQPLGVTSGRNGTAIGGRLVAALRSAGYLVAIPEMCWSRARGFDKPYTDCFADIDAAIADLKAHGATAIVVAGQSLGGNAAIAYGATHAGLAGIIGFAPADDPVGKAHRPEIAANIEQARALVAQGKGDEKITFMDVNTGPQGSFAQNEITTPRIYLSFNAPDSPAHIPATITGLKAPILWIAGDNDPTQRGGQAFAFDKAPANPLNRYVTVSASHLETPDAGTQAALDWLAALQKKS